MADPIYGFSFWILDSETGESLKGAKVTLHVPFQEKYTDEGGVVTFVDIPEGWATITITAAGYLPLSTSYYADECYDSTPYGYFAEWLVPVSTEPAEGEVTDGISDDLEVSTGWFSSVINEIKDSVTGAFGKVGDALDAVKEYIGDKVTDVYDLVTDYMEDVKYWISNSVEGMIITIKTAISNVVSIVGEKIAGAFTTVKEFISEAYQTTRDFVAGVVDKVTDTYDRIIAAIKGFIDGAIDAAGEMLSEAWTRIREILSDTLNGASDYLVDKVTSFIFEDVE